MDTLATIKTLTNHRTIPILLVTLRLSVTYEPQTIPMAVI